MNKTEPATSTFDPIVRADSLEEYLALPYLSRSDLAHFISGQKPTGSQSISLGTLTHMLVLEPPDELAAKFITLKRATPHREPESKWDFKAWDYDLRTKEGRAARDHLQQQHPDKTIVKYSMKMHAATIARRFKEHAQLGPVINAIRNDVIRETTLVAKPTWSTQPLKARADLITHKAIIDLKTTHARNLTEFKKSFNDFLYFVQAALLQELWREASDASQRLPVIFVCVCTDQPHDTYFYEATPDEIQMGIHWTQSLTQIIERYGWEPAKATAPADKDVNEEITYPSEFDDPGVGTWRNGEFHSYPDTTETSP